MVEDQIYKDAWRPRWWWLGGTHGHRAPRLVGLVVGASERENSAKTERLWLNNPIMDFPAHHGETTNLRERFSPRTKRQTEQKMIVGLTLLILSVLFNLVSASQILILNTVLDKLFTFISPPSCRRKHPTRSQKSENTTRKPQKSFGIPFTRSG